MRFFWWTISFSVWFIVCMRQARANDAEQLMSRLLQYQAALTADFSVEKWGITYNREDQYRLMRKANIGGLFKSIVGNEPILVYEGPTYLDSRIGNVMGDYFEAVACAFEAGLHFVCVADHSIMNTLSYGLKTIIPHQNPTKNSAIEQIKEFCPDLHFPWEHANALTFKHPELVRDNFGPAVEAYRIQNNISQIPLSEFSAVGGVSRPNLLELPAIPDAVIMLRCVDIIYSAPHHGQYGFVNWQQYAQLIPANVSEIYILTEPLDYTGKANKGAIVCKSVVEGYLLEFLRKRFKNAVIAVRRGYVNMAMIQLLNSNTVVCTASTFCMYPALSRTSGMLHIQQSGLFSDGTQIFLSSHASWIGQDQTYFSHLVTKQDFDPESVASTMAAVLSSKQTIPSEFPYPDGVMIACTREVFLVYHETLRAMSLSHVYALHMDFDDTISVLCGELVRMKKGEPLPLPATAFADQNPQLVVQAPSRDQVCHEFSTTNYHMCDRVSIIYFKLLADFHFGKLPVAPEMVPVLNAKKFSPETAAGRNRTIIFIDSPSIELFLESHLNKIEGYFVIISGDSDMTVPGLLAGSIYKALESPRLLHWFAGNCGLSTVDSASEKYWSKFTCIPIGASQWGQARMRLQQAYELHMGLKDGNQQNFLKLKAKKQGTSTVLSAFTIGWAKEYRSEPDNYFCGENATMWEGLVHCASRADHMRVDESTNHMRYYKLVSESRFVVSPRGMGIDCYRNYEILLMGSYPIMLSSGIDALFKDLPVVIVQRWSDVTPALLDAKYEEFTSKSYDFSPLYMSYWNATIQKQFLL